MLIVQPAARRAILAEAQRRSLDLAPFTQDGELDLEAVASHMLTEDENETPSQP